MFSQQFWEVGLSLKSLLIIIDVAIHEAIGQCGVGVDVHVELQINVLYTRTLSITQQ